MFMIFLRRPIALKKKYISVTNDCNNGFIMHPDRKVINEEQVFVYTAINT